jgi:hypothetical protein
VKIVQFIFLMLALSVPLGVAANPPISLGFQSPQDALQEDSGSGISLHNGKHSDATLYGLYIRQLAYVAPGGSCNTATTIYNSATNLVVGGVVAPVTMKANESASLGKNYLYNMLLQAFYYVGIIYPSTPPGCALPGCTWGSDSTLYNWCIYLGALAPVTTTGGYTAANVPPSTELASSGAYDYNLISSYITLGPIACDDEALSCHVANKQTQSFT